MKKNIFYITVLAFTFLMNSCDKESKNTAEVTENADSNLIEVMESQFKAMKMEVGTPKDDTFQRVVSGSGQINVSSHDRAKITPFISGYIKTSPLLVGDKVSKGQVLFTIESPEFVDLQKDYLEAAGQLDYLQSEYERQRTLFAEKISSQKKYLEAESMYKVQKANYNSLKEKLRMLNIDPNLVEKGTFFTAVNIYSPISGDITNITTNLGTYVSPTDIVMEIVDTNNKYLELSLFEKDIMDIEKGQGVSFMIPQMGDKKFSGTISKIGKSVEGANRTIDVIATLDGEAQNDLWIGMYAEARVVTGERNVLSIPFDAVFQHEADFFVLLLQNNEAGAYHFSKQKIEVGERDGDFFEIVSDNINKDSTILIKGVYDLI